jgi:dGTP triphosphohydrolase
MSGNKDELYRPQLITESEPVEDISGENGDCIGRHTMPQQAKSYTIRFVDDMDTEFLVFHKITFEVIQAWAVDHTQMDNNWMQWRKWTFAGLKALQSAQQIKKIFQVNSIFDYKNQMKKFPPFSHTFELQENKGMGEVKYTYHLVNVFNPRRNQILHTQEDLDHFMNVFYVKTHNLQNYMMNIQHRVEAFEQQQQQYYTTVKQTTQQLISSIVNSSVTAFKQTIDSIVAEKVQLFEGNLNQVVDEMLQDVYAASEEANSALKVTTERQLKEFDVIL